VSDKAPTRVSAEEMRCLKLLEAHPAEWAWFMTDEEMAVAQKAIERRKTEREEIER
jgi:hypothetical protein